MKHLQINTVTGTGSIGRITCDIYKMMNEMGHESLVAYGRNNSIDGFNSIRIGSNSDNIMHGIYTRINDKHGFASKKATMKFIEKIKEYNPDIIQLHNLHGYYLNIEILFNYLREANKPVIWTLHDCWAFTGHCAYFDYVNCNKWKDQCYKCPQKKQYPTSILLDRSKWSYKSKRELFTSLSNLTIITPSDWLADLVKQSFLNKYPVYVINNGIDLELFKPTSSNFKKDNKLNDKFILLGVADGWEERKGYKYFIELSKQLDNYYKIVLVGVTEKQRQELPTNILGITKTNNITELAEIYSAADVFLNPTLEEVLGLVNIEALACGTPVITFDTGGSVECIDESCGLIVEKENSEKLLKAIKKLENRNFSSDNCVKRSKLFDKNDRYKEYINLYEKSMGEF